MKQKLIKIKNIIIKYIKDPKLFLSFLLAWLITNGWAYILIGVGFSLKIKWMSTVGASYVAFLWLPCTPEKLVTIPLSVFIYKLLNKKKGKENEIKRKDKQINQ